VGAAGFDPRQGAARGATPGFITMDGEQIHGGAQEITPHVAFDLHTGVMDRRARPSLRPAVAMSWREQDDPPGVYAVMRTMAADAVATHARLIRTPTPETVHAFRRILRRLRAVIRLFAELLPPGDAGHLAHELKWMTRQLGPVRDLDVLQARLRLDTAYTPQTVDEDALIGLVAEERRCAAHAAVAAARSARAVLQFAGLSSWLRRQAQVLNDGAILAEHVVPRLRAQDAAILKDGRDIGRLNGARRHRLRSRIKALRYALEALPWLGPADNLYTSALADLHTVLGDMNDDAVGRRLMRALRRSQGLDGPRRYRGPSSRERGAALESAWTRFQEAGAERLYDDNAVRPRGRRPPP
jgi:CHAD domain-containing protein